MAVSPISLPKGFTRLSDFSIDSSAIHASYAAAVAYATSNPTAYVGQIVSTSDQAQVYVVGTDKALIPLLSPTSTLSGGDF